MWEILIIIIVVALFTLAIFLPREKRGREAKPEQRRERFGEE